ncbi:MAG TPA: hypothetical protein VFJ04_02740, partial [Rhodanobacteraceae bacterium]|nr:hypothetical protein [Rhodanobacteraceae bacterium]
MSALDFIVDNEAALRFGGFVLVLAALAFAERRWALRGDGRPARRQWSNLALVAIDTAVLRFAFPLLAVALAFELHSRGAGLFGWLTWPEWLEIVLAVLVFDAAIYWQHRLLHRI